MVGAALLLYGVLAQGSVVLPWFVPVCDVAAVLSLATTVALGSLDTQLRRTLRLVKSKPDRGSTFLLSPPLAPTTAGRSVSASVTASRSGSR